MNGVNNNNNIVIHNKYESIENFKKITSFQKVMAVFVTFLATVATAFIATVFVFREIVWHYCKNLPQKNIELSQYLKDIETEEDKERDLIIKEADQAQNEALEKAEEAILKENDLQPSTLSARSIKIKGLGLDETKCNLVHYILDFLDDLKSPLDNDSKKIQDSDCLAFYEGKILVTDDTEVAQESYKIFHLILKETFGLELAESVFGRYLLHKKDTITLLDLKKAMVGIAMNVKERDLRNLFNAIKLFEPGNLSSYRAGNFLYKTNEELYEQIRNKNSFEDLTPAEINFLHGAFRTVPMSSSVSVAEVLNKLRPEAADPQNLLWKKDYIYWHDLEGLAEMEYWRDLDLRYSDLALGEYVGKALGYVELRKGMIIPIPELLLGCVDPQDPPYFYKVHSSLLEKNDGVIAHILAPLNPQQKPIEKDDNTDHAFFIFRGTNIDCGAKAAGQSLYRDLHWAGIGRATYNAREADVQALIENYLVNAKDNVTVHLAGHSLGGCDTQRALVSILEKVASAPEGSPWKKLKKVVLTTFNAPKPNPTVNKRFKQAVKEIHEKGIKIDVDLKHVRFFDMNHEDWLQHQGDILLGADLDGTEGTPLKEAPFLKRELILMKMLEEHGKAEGFLTRHQYRPFNKRHTTMVKGDDVIKYEMKILNSENEQERMDMEKYMAGAFFWDFSTMTGFRGTAYRAGWVAGDAVRHVGRGLQAVANGFHYCVLGGARHINGDYYNEDDARRLAVE